MKLNKQGRDELRAKITKQLQNVPNGQRIHLDKELLEQLLFETIVYNKETGASVKLPFWSGEFLSKIDLSEINFDNVSWVLLSQNGRNTAKNFFNKDLLKNLEKLLDEVEKKKKDDEYYVDYSNTNASIDFSKSFETTYGNKKSKISDVNFYGVDFSNLDISMFFYVSDSNLGNTGIKASSLDGLYSKQFWNVSFENCDLSNITLNAMDLIDGEMPFTKVEIPFKKCTFTNSKLNIIYNSEDLKLKPGEIGRPDFYKSCFVRLLKTGWFNGCYLNGNLIKLKSKEEIEKNKQQKREEYEKYKQDILSTISQTIEEQMEHIKK